MVRKLIPCLLAFSLAAGAADLKEAEQLYQRTEYERALKILQADFAPDAETLALIGRNYYMLGEYKKSVDALQKATVIEPSKAEYAHWLGRALGRRAETASPLLAPGIASKARVQFERAVELDPKNEEALNDLFDYYLQAPGFLGGGLDKAEATARKIEALNPAEGHFALAQLAERRKEFDTAEDQLRRAVALAPKQVGRLVDLAKYLAKRGRYQESDAAFQQAVALAPNNPKLMYERAQTYIAEKRRLDEARELLNKYLQSSLTPDDPSKHEARKLLSKVPAA